MQEVYNKYIETLTNTIQDTSNKLDTLLASYNGFNNVYKSYIITPNKELDILIRTSTNYQSCRINKYKIQVLMQEDNSNKELYIAAIRLSSIMADSILTKVKLHKLKQQYITYELFLILYKRINKTIEHRCLLGDVYYTKGIGSIQIEICSWNNKINWQKTNELKQLPLSKGISLYDANTGKGSKYIIYHDNDTFPLWKWHRNVFDITTKYMKYSFKPVVKIKTEDRKMSTIENSKPDINTILNHKDIGSANKLILLTKVHPSILSNYAN